MVIGWFACVIRSPWRPTRRCVSGFHKRFRMSWEFHAICARCIDTDVSDSNQWGKNSPDTILANNNTMKILDTSLCNTVNAKTYITR